MAGYGCMYRGGYMTYDSGAVPVGGADGWSKTRYDSDHKCQPVYIDSNGRRNPVKSYTTPNGKTGYYITKTEVVEVPTYVSEYKLSTRPLSPEKWRKSLSPVRYHVEEKWTKPSSPVRYHVEEKLIDRPSSSSPVRYHTEQKLTNRTSSPVHEHAQVEDFLTKVQTQASRPNKFGPVSATYWRQTPTVVTETGSGAWAKPNHVLVEGATILK